MARTAPYHKEDTTPAAKRKMCWKCQKYNVPGAEFCAFCGAQFATDNDHYQTDGRTVSDVDTTAYLSAPPPKVKKPHRWILLAFAIVVVGVIAILIASSTISDATYNYEEVSRTPDGWGDYDVVYILNIRNNRIPNAVDGNLIPVLYAGSNPHYATPPSDLDNPLPIGTILKWRCTYNLSASELLQPIHFEWRNVKDSRSFDIVRDSSMFVEH